MSSPTAEQANLFRRQGYAVFPNWLTNEELSLLRTTCDALMSEPVDDDKGGTAHNIGRGHESRFLRHRHADFPELALYSWAENEGICLASTEPTAEFVQRAICRQRS